MGEITRGPLSNSSGNSPVITSGIRNGGILHRNGITTRDLITNMATPSGSVGASVGNLANIAYNFAVAASTRYGPSTSSSIGTSTPALNVSIRITIAQASPVPDFYEIFLSTGANPLWVCRITEAQRVSGGFQCTAVGTVVAGTSPAGTFDVGVVGTGVANNAAPFVTSNAYVLTGITPINCAGYSKAHILSKIIPSDLRSQLSYNLMPFYGNQLSPTDFFQGTNILILCGAVGATQLNDSVVTLDGASQFLVALFNFSGQSPTFNIWVELA